jgi:fermentation-respiration switch protein FrsA (DUF1100 family)
MADVALSFLAVLAIPAIVVILIAVTRRSLQHKAWPPARKLLADIVISMGITLGITLAVSLVLSWSGFFQSQFFRPSRDDYGQHRDLGMTPEEVTFASRDGTQLHGWFLPATREAIGTVIHFHGSDRNISWTIKNCHWLVDAGFNVMLFDYRGFGKSDGKPSPSGVLDDSVAAIKYVRSLPAVDRGRICLWGQSMGGQLAIVAAQRTGDEGIRAVVAEATYGSYRHHIKDKMASLGPLWLVQWGAWLVTSDAFAANHVVGQLAPIPLLLVHGTADEVVRPYHSEQLYELAGDPKEIWRVDGGKHVAAFNTSEAQRRLVEYLRNACNREEDPAR